MAIFLSTVQQCLDSRHQIHSQHGWKGFYNGAKLKHGHRCHGDDTNIGVDAVVDRPVWTNDLCM